MQSLKTLFVCSFSPPFCLNNFFKSAECIVIHWMFFQAQVPNSPSSGLVLSCSGLWRNGIILASLRGESVCAVTHTRGNPWRMIKSILQPGRQQLGAFSLTPYLLTTACFLAEKHMKQNVRLQPCDSARHREGIRRLRDGGKTHWKDHGRSTVRTSPEERTLQSVVQCLVRRQPFG